MVLSMLCPNVTHVLDCWDEIHLLFPSMLFWNKTLEKLKLSGCFAARCVLSVD